MPRVKRGVTQRARHKKVLKQAKGFRGRRKNVFTVAKQAVMKAGQYAYRDRRRKKREFRALRAIDLHFLLIVERLVGGLHQTAPLSCTRWLKRR